MKSADLEDDCKKRNDVFQLSVTYDFDYTTETLTGEELMKMIKLKDDGSYTVDRKKAMEYVESSQRSMIHIILRENSTPLCRAT